MLEGLEISEIGFSIVSEGILRLESEFYTIETFESNNYYLGENIIDNAEYNSIYGMNSEGRGYLALRMNEFDTIFTGQPEQFAHNFTEIDFEKHRLRKNDILICRTNGNPNLVGKSALVAKDYPFVYESHLFKIRPIQDKISSAALIVFLNCKYGKAELKKFSMQGNQSNFSLAKFREIRVPKLEGFFNKKIENIVYTAFNKLNDSQDKYFKSEELLLIELGLSGFSSNQQSINIKSIKNSFLKTGRLDAEYYQPKYDEIIEQVKSAPHDKLKNLAYVQKSIEPGSEAYQETGTPFYRVSNLTKFGLIQPDIHLDEYKYSDTIRPKKDTILLSKDGTVGMAYKVAKDIDGITSGAVLHLNIKDEAKVLPDYLTLVLNSIVVQLQAERDAGGSIIQHWKPSEIEEVVIPLLDINVQQKIAELIQQSFHLKAESEQLLEDAKKLVEYAIENGEGKALVNYKLGLIE
ncbi:restriction endonuclease subunit S [Psychrobacter urativorans]|uniref:restriction endonuclease subunit S n=1 Tax=Psychrobacter urativorans TaxID=45610 RepID=UPI00191AEE68|nr:restriction endonuclease subunit S [Psychrobacter urativorans]